MVRERERLDEERERGAERRERGGGERGQERAGEIRRKGDVEEIRERERRERKRWESERERERECVWAAVAVMKAISQGLFGVAQSSPG